MKNVNKTALLIAMVTIAASPAFAQEAHSIDGKSFLTFGKALALGIAAAGGAIAQGRTAAAALDGIARNPAAQAKIFTPMIIGLALIESLVIYCFVNLFL